MKSPILKKLFLESVGSVIYIDTSSLNLKYYSAYLNEVFESWC